MRSGAVHGGLVSPVFASLHVNDMPMQLNITVECLTLLLCIRDVPGSILGPETGYPDLRFT
jgi:hypothetical protein